VPAAGLDVGKQLLQPQLLQLPLKDMTEHTQRLQAMTCKQEHAAPRSCSWGFAIVPQPLLLLLLLLFLLLHLLLQLLDSLRGG
jgi:hypothetical protein